jgi:hypothetical protein
MLGDYKLTYIKAKESSMQKFIKKTTTCLLMALLIPIMAVASTNQFPPKNAPENTKYLFTQSSMYITVSAGKLVLHDINSNADNYLAWMSNKYIPQNDGSKISAGGVSFNRYMQLAWGTKNAGFNAEKPNAVVKGDLPNGERFTMTVILKSAHYSKRNHTLTYTTAKPLLVQGKKPAGSSFTLKYGTMVIDSLMGSISSGYNGAY